MEEQTLKEKSRMSKTMILMILLLFVLTGAILYIGFEGAKFKSQLETSNLKLKSTCSLTNSIIQLSNSQAQMLTKYTNETYSMLNGLDCGGLK